RGHCQQCTGSACTPPAPETVPGPDPHRARQRLRTGGRGLMSLRRFLLLWLSVTLIAVLGLAAVLGYLGSRHEAEELLDAQMAQYARLLYANLDRLHRDPALLGPIVLSADTGQTDTASGHR